MKKTKLERLKNFISVRPEKRNPLQKKFFTETYKEGTVNKIREEFL